LGPKCSGFEAEISGFRRTDLLGSFPGPILELVGAARTCVHVHIPILLLVLTDLTPSLSPLKFSSNMLGNSKAMKYITDTKPPLGDGQVAPMRQGKAFGTQSKFVVIVPKLMSGRHPKPGMMHSSTTPLPIMHERYVFTLSLFYRGSCFHKPRM